MKHTRVSGKQIRLIVLSLIGRALEAEGVDKFPIIVGMVEGIILNDTISDAVKVRAVKMLLEAV